MQRKSNGYTLIVRAGIWIDSRVTLEKWQIEAIRNVKIKNFEIVMLFALRNSNKKQRVRFSNLIYYLTLGLQRKLVSSAKRARVSNVKELKNLPIIWLDYESEEMWKRVNVATISEINELDVIIKFDSSLLKNPEDFNIPLGILSFHHGNPEKFRGRPSIFWELVSDSREIGIVVQQLSSKLDAGKVLAKANVGLIDYSYRKNFINLYHTSKYMLSKALVTAQENKELQTSTSAKLYKLPDNATSWHLLKKLMKNKCRHILHVLFLEKIWWIAKIATPSLSGSHLTLSSSDLRKIGGPDRCYFVADPMIDSDGSIFAEVVKPPLFKGSISVFKNKSWSQLSGNITRNWHYSYPQIVSKNDKKYIFAETAFHSAPNLMELSRGGSEIISIHFLKGLEDERIADGTLFEYKDNWYLFGSAKKSKFNLLHLWVAKTLEGEFVEHDSSPICLDITSQRMAGPIIGIASNLFRFGQDSALKYGSRISVNKIVELSPSAYQESEYGKISLESGFGPHTLSILGETALIDGYEEHWSPTAMIRKILARI